MPNKSTQPGTAIRAAPESLKENAMIQKTQMFQKLRRSTSILAVATLAAVALTLASPTFAASAQVNINSASAEQLTLLPRVGASVAARIVEFRKENGPFKSAEDLMLVRGIGEKTFEGMRSYVAVSGDTTLKEKVAAPRAAKPAAEPKG